MNKKVDDPRIAQKIKEIEENLELIQENLPNNFNDFNNLGLVKDGIYKRLEYCLQNLVDIFSIIYTSLRIGIPSNLDDIFKGLSKKKIFPKRVMELVQEMKGLRNILVHQYGKIDDAKVYEILSEKIDDLNDVIAEVEKFIKKK